MHVPNASVHNLTSAIFLRLFYTDAQGSTPQKPVSGAYSQMHSLRAKLVEYLTEQPRQPWTVATFLSRVRPRQRATYTRAAQEFAKIRWTAKAYTWWSRIKAFVKAEKTLKSLMLFVPRLISPRSMEFNIALGLYLKPLEKPVYAALNRFVKDDLQFPIPTHVVAKGLNAEQTGKVMHAKWSQFSDPVAVGIDAKRFDQHVSVDALEFEHGFYNSIYDCDHLRELLRHQLQTTGVGFLRDGKINYQHNGGRCSGDMNTSLGNILLMCCMCIHLIQLSTRHIDFINNGDDVVFFCERSSLQTLSDLIREVFPPLGFTIQVEEPVYIFEHIEFCQTHPVFDGWRWIMVRNWPDAFYKDCLSVKSLDGKCAHTYYNAIGACGLALAGGIPIYQDFYRHLISITNQHAKQNWNDISLETGMFQLAAGMNRYYREATLAARTSFYMAFNVTPTQQIAIAKAIVKNIKIDEMLANPPGDLEALVTRSPTPFCESTHQEL
ncbi:hypothetical protein SOG_gp2 [Marine RNA virus SOG]|uniref:hypothetical protein n=1 Tax=Marine RNA virus SOG TaxID=439014 RepID=UPI0001589CC6|nr:hypothetical protein SOG_gp2 [Marine RNA virus SOG]ABQ50597.1 unknown [Marine RNA virus SOG]